MKTRSARRPACRRTPAVLAKEAAVGLVPTNSSAKPIYANPYAVEMASLLAEPQRRVELQAASRDWFSWDLTSLQLCDLELLLNGGFLPLQGFMDRADYESVCSSMRLSSGLLWPIPVTLDVSEELAKKLECCSRLALRDPEGVMLAVLSVEEVWQPDQMAEAEAFFGTTSRT